jgi:hypothetical protein
MIKLIDLLFESNIVRVPKEILSKLGDIYDYTKNNLEKIKEKSPESPRDSPYVPNTYNKYLKFKDLANKDIEISIGYYNDPSDVGSGRMDTANDIMLINLYYFGDKEDFLELGEHELIHAMDPKVRDSKLFGREYIKKGAEPAGQKLNLSKSGDKSEYERNLDKYLKSPWEFDSFTGPLLNKLKRSLERAPNKSAFRSSLNKLFSIIRTKSVSEIINDSTNDKELSDVLWYLSDREWKPENYQYIENDAENELLKIKSWTTKPTLYKRFLQRYATTVK